MTDANRAGLNPEVCREVLELRAGKHDIDRYAYDAADQLRAALTLLAEIRALYNDGHAMKEIIARIPAGLEEIVK